MTIVLTALHKGGDHTLEHDLNFQAERYEATHTVVCRPADPRDRMAPLTDSAIDLQESPTRSSGAAQ